MCYDLVSFAKYDTYSESFGKLVLFIVETLLFTTEAKRRTVTVLFGMYLLGSPVSYSSRYGRLLFVTA
jgi:hypothetical protein